MRPPRHRPLLLLTPLALFVGVLPTAAQSPAAAQSPVPAGPEVVKEEACADADGFQCVTLRMPLDHFADAGRTIDVTYAFRPHDGKGDAKGTFVTLTGGPGSSGIASAASYTDSFDDSIRRRYDIVFLDQRGAHLSGDLTCPDAALAWYRTTADPAESTATTGLGADAHAFVDACIAESKVDPEILPYLGTSQAVEDLDAIREHLGVDSLAVYGESFGTQYAQQYAAAHPDHVAKLILDGPVDLSRSLFDYYDEQTHGFDLALEGTLYDCSTARACTRDIGLDAPNALDAWDSLAEELASSPMTFEFHGSDGRTEEREFSAGDLLNAGSAFLYSEYDRMLLQRALAAASQGDLWYLSRLLYSGLVMDPDTQEAIPDPSYSDGLYYAVECLDYAIPGDTPEARASAYLAAGKELGMADRRMGDMFYGDLPCAFWPAQPESAERPALLQDVPYPMLVLGATLDPATPWANGERIADAAGVQSIVKPGGPHVIFGRGEACPDDLVTDFLVSDADLDRTRVVCPGDVADTYVPLPPVDALDYGTTLAALRDVDRELVTSADYWYWDALEPLTTGCRFGGTVRYTPDDAGTRLRLEACAWSRGLPLTGTGLIDDDAGTLTLRVRRADTDAPVVRYRRDAKDQASVDREIPGVPRDVP
ncbi:MAG: alpha/beta fold hydrolase [Chloroflexota bacterium]